MMKKLLTYFQLFRLPNVFTAMADIIAGFVFVRANVSPALSFACLLIASSLMYIAGMVLNDVFDVEQDRKERPQRPIPSGRISLAHATQLGWGLLVLGILAACMSGLFLVKNDPIEIPWRGAVIAVLLAGCIIAYDAKMKRTPAGPLFMGACRSFNLLLGMSAAGAYACEGPTWLLNYEAGQLLIAGGVGIYIAGVTWFARTEAVDSSRVQLAGGVAVMVAGLLLVVSYAWLDDLPVFHFRHRNPEQWKMIWQLSVVVIGFTIVRSALMAVYDPRPERVQSAVKTAIM